MSLAEELLNSTTTYTTEPLIEEHIVIGDDRFITVPESLQRIAVQYDHNVETVTFDCPRYWDEHDLSTMYIYINYIRKDLVKGKYLAKDITIDEENPNMIHFNWTISNEITQAKGPLIFLVCAVKTDEDGLESVHWNSELNDEMSVSEGLETDEVVINMYPDIITDLLTKMDSLKAGAGIVDVTLTQNGFAADAGAVGERFNTVDTEIDNINTDIEEINRTLEEDVVKEEQDPTVSDWAKQPEKPTYSYTELSDADMLGVKDDTLQVGLNAEKVGGKTVNELMLLSQFELISRYNVPNVYKMWDEYNYLSLDAEISEYKKGMRVFLTIEQQYGDFEESIFPTLTADDTPVKGFSANVYQPFDKNDNTSKSTNATAKITCPMPIKPKTIYYSVSGNYTYTIKGGDTVLAEIKVSASANNNTGTIEITDDDNYYTQFSIGSTSGYARYNTLDIVSGSTELFNKGLPSYLNINNLGDVLIPPVLEIGKKYELVYDGTVFNAREIA